MNSDDRRWIVDAFERITAVSAATSESKEAIREIASQLLNVRQRIDALSIIAAQIGVHGGIAPEYLIARRPELANGNFMSHGYMGFNYNSVLNSIASWNTSQERLAHFDRYDEWFRAHGRGISIIVPSYNDCRFLARCLISLKRVRDEYGSVRVIVADDCSTSPEHIAFLDRIEHEGVLVVRNSVNGGFARNVNSALALVGDEDFVLLNSDTEAEGLWLEALQYGCYASDSGIVGAKLLYPDRRIQHAGVHRNTAAPSWFDHYHRGQSEFFGPACVPSYQLAVTGACLYVSNRAFKKLGVLDPNFPMAFEDVDYCMRSWAAGERVLYYPYARLLHHESPTRGRTQGTREIASQKYFWQKWRAAFDERPRGEAGSTRDPDIVYVLEDTGIAGGHRNIFDHVNLLISSGLVVEVWSLSDHPEWFDLKTQVRRFSSFSELTNALAPLSSIKVATWWNTAEAVWLGSRIHGHCAYLVSDIESSYYVDDPFMQAKVLASYKFDFRFFTISKWDQDQLAKLGIKSDIVSCSVDSSKFRPLGIEKRPDVIMAPGRRNNLKNFEFTLMAWMTLGEDRPYLWMYGGEPDIADFLDRTRYFYKPSDEYLNRMINEATAFVLTSRHEGFALTILEAMSAGTVVITTDCHGNRDFCTDGENCLIVQDGDYSGLTSAIRRVMQDADLRARLTAGGFATARRFSQAAMQRQLLDFFTSFSGMSFIQNTV